MDYQVEWAIDVFDVASPEEAAREARECQIRPDTIATVFDVYESDGGGKPTRVDLTKLDSERG